MVVTVLAPIAGLQVPAIVGTAGTVPPPVPTEYSGQMGDEFPDALYPFNLAAGQAVRITADAVSGDLDLIISIEDGSGEMVAVNDDRAEGDLNSELGFVSPTDAAYTLVVSSIASTSGGYRVVLYPVESGDLETLGREALSGPTLDIDTANFRVHYTTAGEDATTPKFARLVGATMEQVLQIQIGLGWPLPPPDGAMGGDVKFDVYLIDVLADVAADDTDSEFGHAAPELPGGDNPNTAVVEEQAAPSYLVLDNDFAPSEVEPGADPIALMRATAAHEFHHAVQFGYDFGEPMEWYAEATSSWMETVTYPTFQDATGYVEDLFQYPELCLGVQGSADASEGGQKYGEWLFLQSLVDAHDAELVVRLWEQIGVTDGWAPLDTVLTSYGETRVDAVRRFRLQNLLRAYAWTPEFDGWTVWRDKLIDAPGSWSHDGKGVQPLGANYFGVNVLPGSYRFAVDDPSLELWLVGVDGPTASVFALDASRAVDVGAFDFVNLMVFDPEADYDVESCPFTTYGLSVSRVDDTTVASTADFTLDATQYAPLT
jgi:hypothetical protein